MKILSPISVNNVQILKKNRSSSPKALIVMAPAMDSARWFAIKDLVVPSVRINSFAEAK